ncbi:MAG: serine hydrolase [Bacteroidetes bacterium]|nr:serine hydrolase [Bacteroidota bacterium]
MNRFFLFVFSALTTQFIVAQNKKSVRTDSVLQKMTVEEKVGQLISVPFSSTLAAKEIQTLRLLVKENAIGKMVVTHSGPVAQVNWVNEVQTLSKIPVLFGGHFSTDLSGVFDSTFQFYNSTVLRSVANDTLLAKVNTEKWRQLNLLGVYDTSSRVIANLDPVFLQDKKTRDQKIQHLLTKKDFISLPLPDIEPFIKTFAKTLQKNNSLKILLDSAVKNILIKKQNAQLHHLTPLLKDNIIKRLHPPEALRLKEQLAWDLVKVTADTNHLIPIKKIDNLAFASISIGRGSQNELTHYLSKYADFSHFSIQSLADTTGLLQKVTKKTLVVALFLKNLGEEPAIKKMIQQWSSKNSIIICRFYKTDQPNDSLPTLNCFDISEGLAKVAAEKIFGARTLNRFTYTRPEAASMDSEVLNEIESIAQEAISTGATPGCHVLIARHSKVVYEKSFGTLEYNKKSPITDETIFDLASVTKVSATLQAVMYLYEKGMIDINKKASLYLPELKGTNKEDMIIKDILTHQAGLWPYLPFWTETVKDSSIFKKYYSRQFSYEFPYPVAQNLYASKSMKDSLWRWIIKSKIRDKPARSVYDYKYSDMGFYIMQHLAEKLLKTPLEDFLQKNIYQPLGAYTTGYLPLRKFPSGRIAPTEKDTLFRKSLLVGYVHDQGAAMHGGIAGHAGLFSSANDLAKLGQLWLNKGSYGGVQVFKPETIDFFTTKQYEDSRRGLGWDKPVLNDWNGPTSYYASAKTFGHTGFTGTCIWVDPEFDLVYVFLSNRVNPHMNNNKLLNENIRPRIQDVIYQSIFNYCSRETN